MLDGNGEPLVCVVEIDLNEVYLPRLAGQRGPHAVYLLDTNLPRKRSSIHRDLTSRVYGGDSTTRIMQEILLGIGGVRLLRALGIAALHVPHE